MMFERFDDESKRSLFFARDAVSRHGGACIEVEHLLLGVLRAAPTAVVRFVTSGADADAIESRVVLTLPDSDGRVSTSVEIPFSDAAKRTLQRAVNEADDMAGTIEPDIHPTHLVLAIAGADGSHASRVLGDFGITAELVRRIVNGHPSAVTGTPRTVAEQPTLARRFRVSPRDMGSAVPAALNEIAASIQVVGGAVAGPAYTRYLEHDEGAGVFELEVGIPLAAPCRGTGDVLPSELPGGLAITLWHLGPYESLGDAHAALSRAVEARGLTPAGGPWEAYVVSASTGADSDAWRTELVQLVSEGKT